MKKILVLFLLVASNIVVFAGGSQGEVTMRVGDIENVANLGAIALDRYADLIAEKSNGTIKVRAFHASQMGSAMKQLELVKSGTLESFRGSISWLVAFDTGFGLTDFPFLCANAEQAKIIALSPALARLNDKLAETHGMRFVTAGWIRLPRQILLSKEVSSIEELKGIKIRVPESYAYIESFKALGFAPTPVAFAEVYLALKQGVVDGAENHVESLYNMKWYETSKHLYITDHSYDITGFIVNDKWWQGLTQEQRDLIVSTYDEVDQWFIEQNANLQDEYIEKMKAEGGVQVHIVDKESYRNMVYPQVMMQAEKNGEWEAGLWEEIQNLLK